MRFCNVQMFCRICSRATVFLCLLASILNLSIKGHLDAIQFPGISEKRSKQKQVSSEALESPNLLQSIRLGQATWDFSETEWALGKVQEAISLRLSPDTKNWFKALKHTLRKWKYLSIYLGVSKVIFKLRCSVSVPVI